jgi:hypothetical protein
MNEADADDLIATLDSMRWRHGFWFWFGGATPRAWRERHARP